ncbi:MAG: acyl-CoA ligase (AMP-forming), exosortase A system-associated [Gammaproteobacteria bacterium]|nr:MAG: acyl-CoA ligase (AMP-forming), exosortase A system-associated [Gammaproteobacteria bacterium]
MPSALHELVARQAALNPTAEALRCGDVSSDYASLWRRIRQTARWLQSLGANPGDRLALWLPKSTDGLALTFAASAAGLVFVPINPVLKPAQVGHILRDAGARFLATQATWLTGLKAEIEQSPELQQLITVDQPVAGASMLPGGELATDDIDGLRDTALRGGDDLAALFYTSGSTGQPKGVMISHANLLDGARIVADYLGNGPEDRLLAVLPLSFDYGFSQITTAFHAGASVVLLDHVLPRQIPAAVAQHRITGLAGVPSLWNRLAPLDWPDAARKSLRYLTNSGGQLPRTTLDRLRRRFPNAELFLMYGLTEAFRSTYLPPALLEAYPDAMGLPIPGVEIHVVDEDGHECAAGEVGELVHVGPLVAKGYWRAPEASAAVFRRWHDGRPAVWSGDRVERDHRGLLYFRGRRDAMIKTSGYRVSPDEIEAVARQCEGVQEAVALGLPDPMLGQQIAVAYQGDVAPEVLSGHLRAHLPTYMQPARLMPLADLPLTPNGKPDRTRLRARLELDT